MEYLIDTHVLIWYIEGDPALPSHLVKVLDDDSTIIIISMASLWELTIKVSSGKLKLSISTQQLQQRITTSRNFKVLDVKLQHLNILQILSHHHGDPFDRMIISQAITEGLTIISADRQFNAYDVNVSW